MRRLQVSVSCILFFLQFCTGSEVLAQNWRGNLNAAVTNSTNNVISMSVLDANNNVFGQDAQISPNMTMTWQKLAQGDRVRISVNGQVFTRTLGNQDLRLRFNGSQLLDLNNPTPIDPPSPNGQDATITILNKTNAVIRVGWALPRGGGTSVSEINANGFGQQTIVVGSQMNVESRGKFYDSYVTRSGTLVIENNAVAFEGQRIPENDANPSPNQQRLGFSSQPSSQGGLQVISVESGSLAEAMGLQAGDLIKQFNNSTIFDGNQYQAALSRARSTDGKVVLRVQLAGSNRVVPLHTKLTGAGPNILGGTVNGVGSSNNNGQIDNQ